MINKALQKGKIEYPMGHHVYGMALHSVENDTNEERSQKGLFAFFREGLQFMKKEIPFFAIALLIGAELLDDTKNLVSDIVDNARVAIQGTGISDWLDGIDPDDTD